LSTIGTSQSSKTRQPSFLLVSAIALIGTLSPFLVAQGASGPSASDIAPVSDALPDAPGVSSSAPVGDSGSFQASAGLVAPNEQHRGLKYNLAHSDTIIFPGETAPPLSARQKVVLGLKDSVSPFSIAGWVGSAGWSQLWNSSPNYGTDKGAFGQRLAATAARNASQDIFGNVVLAPILHEDPRYYEMGRGHNFIKRSLYAATRVLITRTDSGHMTPNYSLIGGNLAGAALTNAYYPTLNQGFTQTAMTFGNSLGGSAVGMVFSEFYDDALRIVHLKQ
jgi:hypothetical protein